MCECGHDFKEHYQDSFYRHCMVDPCECYAYQTKED